MASSSTIRICCTMNSINLCKLLGKEKKQTELYIGSVPYNWQYLVAGFTADCTEALPLSIFDKTICGILNLDGRVHVDVLGDILGLNIRNNPTGCEYRDSAEYSLLFRAVQSLVDFNMVSRDADGYLQLTEIGREYYLKGKKFRTTVAKSFKVYLDITGAGHAKAKSVFQDVVAKGENSIILPFFQDEQFLKGFIHEQLPDIYDPQKGNSFTNVCAGVGTLYTTPVQIAALYDVLTKETRFVAILENRVSKGLTEVVAANAKLFGELQVSLNTHLNSHAILLRDSALQERFETSVLDTSDAVTSGEDVATLVPSVIEPEEFWNALPLIIGEKEKQVYFRLGYAGPIELEAIENLAHARPETNIFLALANTDEPVPENNNLFTIQKILNEDFLCCTESVTYAVRGYPVTIGDFYTSARMVYRYPEAETDTDALRVQFAEKLLPSIYSVALQFLDKEFEPTRRSVRNIDKCDARVNVFCDFLNEDLLEKLRAKKQETFNRVKLDFEKTLIEKVTDLLAKYSIEAIGDLKGIEELSTKIDEIVKDTDDTYVSLQETLAPIRTLLREREMYIREEKMAKFYIIDTNVFLDDPDILSKIPRRDRVVLAAGVVTELDKMKFKSTDPEKAANARKAARTIKDQIQKDKKSKKKFLILETADMSLLHPEFREEKGDNYILGVAVKFRDRNPFLLTSDNLFSIAAEVERIPTVSLKEFYEKNGIAAPSKPEASSDSPVGEKTYMEVYKDIYAEKGKVLLNKFEKECKKVGLTPDVLGYETFFDFVVATPEFSLSTNTKGITYVNLKR